MPPGSYRTPSGKIKARPNPDPFFKPLVPGKTYPEPAFGKARETHIGNPAKGLFSIGRTIAGETGHVFGAADHALGKAAHYIGNAEHTHNVQMKQQFAAMDARGGPNDPFGSLVHLVGALAKNSNIGQMIRHKGIYDKRNQTPIGTPLNLKTAPVNADEVSPGGIRALIQAGGAVFMPKVGETVDSLMARVGQHVNVTRLGPRTTPGSESIPGRIPMVIAKRTGRITIGANGETHGELLRRMFPNSLTAPYDAYHQGFLFDPAAFDEALGSGATVGERAPMTLNFGRELRAGYSQPKIQALQKFLQDMFQKGSPYTDTEVRPYGPGTRHY